ncbi:MAG: threonine aldolase family protein [Hyphomicrobiaceae bacterium]
MRKQFASDNNAGMCPEALEAFLAANAAGHAIGYGGDDWTQRANAAIQEIFETKAHVHFVFSGTAANALSLAQVARSYNGVIAHAFSHVEMDEAGAPSYFSGGAKLMTADTPSAKLTVDSVTHLATNLIGVHHVKPSALSLTQATEVGTVYTPEEVGTLCDVARSHGLRVHMDGARFANAVAFTGASPADLSWRAGVDILCFGGVKNGLAVGESIVIFDEGLAEEFEWRVKQAGHLNSKMRLVTAAWLGLLADETWLKNARHANAMAQRLATAITANDGVSLMYPVEANAVFVEIPEAQQKGLRDKGWSFYTFLPPLGCRLMCAWDMDAETVDRFAADLATSMA